MKKIIAAAAGLMMVGTLATSASAVESQFGGYWRTRALTTIDFDGQDSGALSYVDTRTRLYYTAVFNENFKFVNKFEWNSTWGDAVGGDIGTDGTGIFRIKNSYADFTTGPVRFKVGTQGAVISRGFLFDDDFAGLYAGVKAGDMANLQFVWAKVSETDIAGGKIAGEEVDLYSFIPVITVSDSLTVTPHLSYVKAEGEDTGIWWLGVDADFSTDGFSLWGTAIYEGGEVDSANSVSITDAFGTALTVDEDVSAWLVAVGGSVGMFHGQAFYATGDDDATPGSDIEAFSGIPGQSYYWSEIMGLGIFDNSGSAGSPENKISNIIAANVGVTAKVTEKLTLSGDLWWAQLAEDDAAVNGEDALGVEVDVKATYAIMDNLNLDLVAAYLFADDATRASSAVTNQEDPIEIGARLSLSF